MEEGSDKVNVSDGSNSTDGSSTSSEPNLSAYINSPPKVCKAGSTTATGPTASMTARLERSRKIWEGDGINVTSFDLHTLATPQTQVTDSSLNWAHHHLLHQANTGRNKPGQIGDDPSKSMCGCTFRLDSQTYLLIRVLSPCSRDYRYALNLFFSDERMPRWLI